MGLWVALGVVGTLAALALRNLWHERTLADRHPPPGRRVETPLGRVHAVDRGNGSPAVLFIHGNPGLADDFAQTVVPRVAERRRAVAVDRPGHGYSDRLAAAMTPADQARIIHAAAAALGLERPIVVGFSFGGPVAVAYALDFPADVRALVLLAPVGNAETGFEVRTSQKLLATPVVGPLVAWTVGPLIAPGAIESGMATAFSPAPADGAAAERARRHFGRPGPLLAAARDWAVLNAGFTEFARRFGQIAVPVEIVEATRDAVVGRPHIDYLATHLPTARRAAVEGAGHNVMYTHPDAVLAAIERAEARASNPPPAPADLALPARLP